MSATTEPVVREAGCADLPAILRLYVRADLETTGELPLQRAEAIHAQMLRTPDYRLYVAESDGELIGSFALLVLPTLGHQGASAGLVEDVAVAPEWQRRGVGRAMMAWAARYCRERGCYKLMLSSNQRRAGAHAFYERLGFERHGYSFRLAL